MHSTSGKKTPSRDTRRGVRILVVFLVFVLLGSALVYRLYDIQIRGGLTYRALAMEQRSSYSNDYAERGEIYIRSDDGDGMYPLAINKVYPLVYVSPKDVDDPEQVSEVLGSMLDIERSVIQAKLSDATDPYEIIARRVDEETAEEILSRNLKGVHTQKEVYRYYPSDRLASQTLGFVGSDGNVNTGRYGIEAQFDDILNGSDGNLVQERDASGRWISLMEREYTKARDGADVVLTLRYGVQYEVERILANTIEAQKADSGSIVVLEARTGNLLALASLPDYNPNEYANTPDLSHFLNPVIQSVYEPGSVFKPITIAIGLDSGVITPESIYTDTGSVTSGGFTIKNSEDKVYGLQNIKQVLEESINTGTIHVEQLVGNERFREMVRKFGFGEKTGLEFPAEASGNVSNLDHLNRDVNFFTVSFGQGISVTPLQLAMSYGVLANDGILMKPRLVESILSDDGTEEYIEPVELRQVISPESARETREMLLSVVENGHGKNASVPGYKVGGKTGTAQVPKTDEAGYSEEDTIGTFAGIGPIDDPRFVVVVKIDRPKEVIWAESSAAPAFSEVMRYLFDYYDVEPTEPIEYDETAKEETDNE